MRNGNKCAFLFRCAEHGMEATNSLKARIDQAAQTPNEAQNVYRDVLFGDYPNDADSVKAKEEAVQRLSDLKVEQKDAAGIRQLLTDLRPLFGKFPKAKTAKIVRNLIDSIAKIPGSTQLQV